MLKLSWDTKIKIFTMSCYIVAPLVLLFNFNLEYLIYAFLYSWFVVHIGISVGMHRCFAHRTFEPKNKIIEYVLHFLALINTVGSTIVWVSTHRIHHKYADTDKDPHKIRDQTIGVKFKYWFNFWETYDVSPKIVKDLISNPTHKFFHQNYFKILLTYIGMLLLIDIDLFLYGYIVATSFSLHWISWITVGAHIFGNRDTDTNDESRNTLLMGILMWGEGWHNNHHAKPWTYEFGWDRQIDFGKYLIRWIGKKESMMDHHGNTVK